MSKKLWGGRFSKKTNPLVEEFTKSIQYDYKLLAADVFGSIAHVNILKKSGYLTTAEAGKLTRGLKFIYAKAKNKKFSLADKDEDIHTYIQNELIKKAGNIALKLHTARSRNDQVVFALKMYSKIEIGELLDGINNLDLAIAGLLNKNKNIILPGFTHLQHAQPVYLMDYFGAYIQMLKRDKERLSYISGTIKLTLGAGALAGTPIPAENYLNPPIPPFFKGGMSVISPLFKGGMKGGFSIKPTINSLDTVSDRDFVIEILSALSILAMHLSRLAEDLIIWSTKEFDFVEIDESFCTGSSLMPQKKRGKR